MMASYTTLLFDLDNTLLDFSKAEQTAITDVFRFFGLDDSEQAVALYSQINDDFWKAFERGDISAERIYTGRFERFFLDSGQIGDAVAVNDRYLRALGDYAFKMPGCDETLSALFDKGYRLSIVTNGVAVNQHRRVADAGLNRWIRQLFISEEIGAKKPDKLFFDRVFESIEEKDRSRVLLIGDSLTSDIQGGFNAGIDTCWLSANGCTGEPKPTYTVRSLDELLTFL